MQQDTQQLWREIEAYRSDEPPTWQAFAQRLARENHWSAAYAERVIAEYKRFVLLAMTSTDLVVPSDAVDQAWHLHLLDSEAYFTRFCPEVLGRTLHHHPSRGGSQEALKHERAYRRTLVAYAACFNEAAPEDIWPAPAARFDPARRFARIDLARYLLVKRPRLRLGRLLRDSQLRVALGLGFGGCASMGLISPFDFKASVFLPLYLVFWLGTLLAAALVRREAAARTPTEDVELHPYEIARLAGGEARVVDTALACLVNDGALLFDPATRELRLGTALPSHAHPIERELCARVAQGADFAVLHDKANLIARDVSDKLQRLQLLQPARSAAFVLALAAPAAALVKLGIGIALHRPVGFLVCLCLAGVHVAWSFFKPARRLSPSGQQLLEGLRREHAPLGAGVTSDDQTSGLLPLAVGLFGLGVISSATLPALAQLFGLGPHASDSGGSCDTGGGCCGGCD